MPANGNGWQRWLIGVLLSLLLGVGAALFNSLSKDIERPEHREERSFSVLLQLSDSVARMETQLEYITKQVK